MRLIHLLPVVLGLAAVSVTVRAADPVDISPEVARITDKYHLPGMAAIVITSNRTVASGVAGVRRLGDDAPITINDQFHLGSCTKAMTATLCGMLVDEGKLSWSTTIIDVFPDIKDKIDPAWYPVTLQLLLTHHAGLPDDRSVLPIYGKLREMDDKPVEARQALMLDRLSQKPAYEPGTKCVYSNSGYAIAGHMAETVTGIPYEQLMRQKLFDPLHMTSAGFGAPGVRDRLTEPRGHTAKGKVIEPGSVYSDNPSALGPGGRAHASLPDWAKFIAFHLSDKPPLLKPATFAHLHTPVDDGSHAAMGWFTAERAWGNGTVLNHNGTNTYWFAVVWVAPKRDFAVLIATNEGGADKATDELAGELVSHFPDFSKFGSK